MRRQDGRRDALAAVSDVASSVRLELRRRRRAVRVRQRRRVDVQHRRRVQDGCVVVRADRHGLSDATAERELVLLPIDGAVRRVLCRR